MTKTAFPSKWQLRQLLDVIEASALHRDGFRYSTGRSQFGSPEPSFTFGHSDYDGAEFWAEWHPIRDVTGYSGVPAGDYHMYVSPAAEAPEAEENSIPWRAVVSLFTKWVSYLEREFEASESLAAFVRLPRLLPPAPPTDVDFTAEEIEIIEPLLIQAEAEFVEVIEEDLATRADLDELREWARAEFADVRAELGRQSKKGFRRTAYGLAANLGMKFGPGVWESVVPLLEQLMSAIDSLPQLPPGS